MLYVTTRSNADAFTVHRALTEERGADGGQYLPFRHPVFSPEEICALKEKSFADITAMVLNRLFGTKLSRFDVEFAVGRHPVRVSALSHRIVMGEFWHNPSWGSRKLIDGLAGLLSDKPYGLGQWVQIACHIAVLFGLYGELLKENCMEPGQKVDISSVSGEFVLPVSALYAKQWGLPVGNVICCCNENCELWHLTCRGQFHTGAVGISTSIPEADVVRPVCLERLVHLYGGTREVERYLESCATGGVYVPGSEVLENLRSNLFVSVVSTDRTEKTIPGVFTTHRYLMTPATALAYAGLLDYRAKKGGLCHSVVLAMESPRCREEEVANCLGIPRAEIKNLM